MNKLNKQRAPFTQVPNTLLIDPDITLKAKGLYALMYSKPDGWQFYETALAKECKEGKEAVSAALDELVKAGWLRRSGGRQEGTNRFCAYDYEILVSRDGLAVTENPSRESRDGKVATSNTQSSNTDEVIYPPTPKGAEMVDPFRVDFELEFWGRYPNKVGKPNALRAYLKEKPSRQELIAGLELWRGSEEWRKDKGRFIPHPATFLNQRRWENTPMSMAPPKTDLDRRNEEFMKSFLAEGQNQQKQIA